MSALEEIIAKLSPGDYFALLVLACSGPILLTRQTLLRATGASLLGAAAGLIGTHVDSGIARFTVDSFPAFEDLHLFAFLCLATIPWAIRAHANNWVPFPQFGALSRAPWQHRALVLWRCSLIVLIALPMVDVVGAFATDGILLVASMGVFGWVLSQCGVPWLPLFVSLTFAPMLEENLRRFLLLARGNFLEFARHPIPIVVAIVLVTTLIVRVRIVRKQVP